MSAIELILEHEDGDWGAWGKLLNEKICLARASTHSIWGDVESVWLLQHFAVGNLLQIRNEKLVLTKLIFANRIFHHHWGSFSWNFWSCFDRSELSPSWIWRECNMKVLPFFFVAEEHKMYNTYLWVVSIRMLPRISQDVVIFQSCLHFIALAEKFNWPWRRSFFSHSSMRCLTWEYKKKSVQTHGTACLSYPIKSLSRQFYHTENLHLIHLGISYIDASL